MPFMAKSMGEIQRIIPFYDVLWLSFDALMLMFSIEKNAFFRPISEISMFRISFPEVLSAEMPPRKIVG